MALASPQQTKSHFQAWSAEMVIGPTLRTLLEGYLGPEVRYRSLGKTLSSL
jgi:hypothetical protein